MYTITKFIQIVISVSFMMPLVACAEKPVDNPQQAVPKSVPAAVAQPVQSAKKFTVEENVHYAELMNTVPSSIAKDKIEVVELFWYRCPHCFQLEPSLKKWMASKADDIELVKMASVLNPNWKLHAQVFYAAEAMGVLEKLHEPMFEALHNQGRRLNNVDAVGRFIGSLGIDQDAFMKTMNSMEVMAKVKRSEQLGRDYEVTGVPALVVGGKYRVLNGAIRSYEEMFQIVDVLADKVRQAKK